MNIHLEAAEHHLAHAVIALDNAAIKCERTDLAELLSKYRQVSAEVLRGLRSTFEAYRKTQQVGKKCVVCIRDFPEPNQFVEVVDGNQCEFEQHDSRVR